MSWSLSRKTAAHAAPIDLDQDSQASTLPATETMLTARFGELHELLGCEAPCLTTGCAEVTVATLLDPVSQPHAECGEEPEEPEELRER